GDDAFEARVLVPRSVVEPAAASALDARALASLGGAPLSIPVVACGILASTLEVASLEAGDALLVEGWPIARGAGGLTGPVMLAAPSSSAGVSARLGDDGRLVLGGDVVPLCAAEGGEMTDAADRSGIVEAIGEVPVVVRVEIGEATMPAREWASLARGDVVALGRRVGEAVTLRVGGVPVARGDLVEIDGEVGVRIVERLPGGGSGGVVR
ncbi:MAG: FliM/FliN family flagellar motor switch protein, partial [Polyangiaceae bacterium]